MADDISLLDALDAGARKLLELAGLGATVSPSNEAAPISLSEQVKAFDAAAEWAKMRPSLVPPEKPKETNFERLKREFDGESSERRGRPRKSAEAPKERRANGVVSGVPEPDASAESGASDLFGA